VNIYLIRAHDLKSRGNDLINQRNDLIRREKDLINQGNDLISREKDLINHGNDMFIIMGARTLNTFTKKPKLDQYHVTSSYSQLRHQAQSNPITKYIYKKIYI